MNDVIAAVATGMPGAIGIVRLSGEGCEALAAKLLRPVSGKAFAESEDRKMTYCRLLDRQGAVIDMVLAVITRAPHSYTGETCCEIHCHGAAAVLTETMTALISLGARSAGPGEFTKRAFLNGRMDLTAAEAVVDLIDAESVEAARNAAGQLGGAVYRRVDGIYENLLSLVSRFQAVVDYPDEDVEDVEREEMCAVLRTAVADLSALGDTFRRGTYLKNGVPAAILGSPNCGKSTLLNALLGYERAIVTDVAGTTRDTVSESVTLGGVRLRLADTAGIRESEDTVERLGIERSLKAAEESELLLLVIDGSRPLEDSDFRSMAACRGKKAVALINKSDLGENPETVGAVEEKFPDNLRISAKNGTGLSALEERVKTLCAAKTDAPVGEILTNARHYDAVCRALGSAGGALSALESGMTPDAAMSDVEICMGALGEITGREVSRDIVNEIFARFCVGK